MLNRILLLSSLVICTALPTKAGAAPTLNKGSFADGCRSGGGSYVENRDGSFQCNLKDGGVIKCPNTSSPCIYIAPRTLPSWARPVDRVIDRRQ